MARWQRLAIGGSMVLAVLAACDREHDPDDFLPTAPSFQQALSVTPSSGSIPADGFSTLQLTARISGDADASRRDVVFTTTAGSFVGAASGTPTTRTVKASAGGVAVADLRSSTQVETAVVDVAVDGVDGLVQRILVDFAPAAVSTVVRISVAATRGDADGVTRIPVFADVDPAIPAAERTVDFSTSLGTFAQSNGATASDIPVDSGNRATVDLISPTDVGTARVTATVNNFTAQTAISFGAALPDAVVVKLDEAALQQGGTETSGIEVEVSRLPGRGTVTDNLEVQYSAVRKDTGASLSLIFRNQTLIESQKATADVDLGDETFTGTATIRARVAGGSAVGEQDIEILP